MSETKSRLFFVFMILSAFLLNFFWESLHGLLFQDHSGMPAGRYVPMMVEMALYDALGICAIHLVVSLYRRMLLWPLTRSNAMIFTAVALLAAAAVEFIAVHVRHEWAYLPSMPVVFGIGLLPLVQLALTGLAAIALAQKLSSSP